MSTICLQPFLSILSAWISVYLAFLSPLLILPFSIDAGKASFALLTCCFPIVNVSS